MSIHNNGLKLFPEQPSLERAIQLTALGFVKPIDEELEQDVKDHLASGHNFYTVLDEENAEIAYAIFCNYQSPVGKVLYLSGVIIDPQHQGRGLNERIVRNAVVDHQPDYFSFRTQSARMYAAGKKIVEVLFPKLEEDDLVIPEDIKVVGDLITRLKGGQFPVTEGCYSGKPLYGVRPHHPSVPAFYELCNFEGGDALLCVGRVRGRQQD